jgi:hypothetical protein
VHIEVPPVPKLEARALFPCVPADPVEPTPPATPPAPSPATISHRRIVNDEELTARTP